MFAARSHPSVCVADSSPQGEPITCLRFYVGSPGGELSPQVTEGWFLAQSLMNGSQAHTAPRGLCARRRVSEANRRQAALRPEMAALPGSYVQMGDCFYLCPSAGRCKHRPLRMGLGVLQICGGLHHKARPGRRGRRPPTVGQGAASLLICYLIPRFRRGEGTPPYRLFMC